MIDTNSSKPDIWVLLILKNIQMRTLKPIRILSLFCLLIAFLSAEQLQGQIGKRIKKKVEDKAVDMADEQLNGKKKKKKKKGSEEEEEEMAMNQGKALKINRNFINRSNTIFFDDFNDERAGEFPSKWTQVSGTVENGSFENNNKTDGVVQMVSNYSTIKPTFDTEDYLGDSFKIELENFFWQKGNEAYVIQLHGNKSSRPAYSIYLRSTNVAPGSDNVVYLAGKQKPGWYTSQISFNRGNLKVIVNGQQVVNNPDINIRTLTHVSLYTISPGSNRADGFTKARVNYFVIAKEGLPLYNRIVTNGRLIVREIYFDVDKYDLKSESYPALDKIVVMLKEHEDMEVTIEGHTDANGSHEDNQLLSEKRAEAVKDYLVDNGIKRSRLSSKGYGEEKPIIEGNDEAALSKNRRVEFVLDRQ